MVAFVVQWSKRTIESIFVNKNGSDNYTFYSLSNRDDLLVAVENLAKRKNNLDYILIEPSGLADPSVLASIFWVDEGLESEVYLDGIVTLVDAKHILKHLKIEDTSLTLGM